jgi:hypothetical protein
VERFSALKICVLVSATKGCVKWNRIANITGRGYLNIGLLFVLTVRVVVGGNTSDLRSINAWVLARPIYLYNTDNFFAVSLRSFGKFLKEYIKLDLNCCFKHLFHFINAELFGFRPTSWVTNSVIKEMKNAVWLRMTSSAIFQLLILKVNICLSRGLRGLRNGSAADRLLGLRVQIPPRPWVSVSCECCVLSDEGLCGGLITGPEESYRLWCVVVWDLETSRMRRPWPALGCSTQKKKKK